MKANVVIGIVASVFVVSLGTSIPGAEQSKPGVVASSHENEGSEGNEARIAVGLDYAKSQGIKLKFDGKNRELVGLGSYLVNAVGGCNDCHTAPSYSADPYAALGAKKQINIPCYLAGGAPFGPPPFGLPPGSPVSRDITPWENGLPAGMTFKQFLHVMRTGEDPDNTGQVLRVMPWPVYQAMTDRDLRAVYEYLTAIPAITPGTCGVPSVS